jgi:KDO2-lipid IV(A) lauroyltransferase
MEALSLGEAAPERVPTLLQRLEYGVLRMFGFAILCTDVATASRITGFLAMLLGRALRERRAIAVDNIRRSMPGGLDAAQASKAVDEVYRALGRTAAEFVHGPRRLRGRATPRWLHVEGAEAYRDIPLIVFVSAHFGNWEHAPAAARTVGINVASIARPLPNPLLDRWVDLLRRGSGSATVLKHGGLRALLRQVKQGWSIGMVVDQSANWRGRLVPFMGRPASTVDSGVVLARRFNAPVCVGTMLRRRPGEHTLYLDPPLWVGEGKEGVDRALIEMNLRFERHIMRRPTDWLWLHRRWKVKEDWNLVPVVVPGPSDARAAETATTVTREGGNP